MEALLLVVVVVVAARLFAGGQTTTTPEQDTLPLPVRANDSRLLANKPANVKLSAGGIGQEIGNFVAGMVLNGRDAPFTTSVLASVGAATVATVYAIWLTGAISAAISSASFGPLCVVVVVPVAIVTAFLDIAATIEMEIRLGHENAWNAMWQPLVSLWCAEAKARGSMSIQMYWFQRAWCIERIERGYNVGVMFAGAGDCWFYTPLAVPVATGKQLTNGEPEVLWIPTAEIVRYGWENGRSEFIRLCEAVKDSTLWLNHYAHVAMWARKVPGCPQWVHDEFRTIAERGAATGLEVAAAQRQAEQDRREAAMQAEQDRIDAENAAEDARRAALEEQARVLALPVTSGYTTRGS